MKGHLFKEQMQVFPDNSASRVVFKSSIRVLDNLLQMQILIRYTFSLLHVISYLSPVLRCYQKYMVAKDFQSVAPIILDLMYQMQILIIYTFSLSHVISYLSPALRYYKNILLLRIFIVLLRTLNFDLDVKLQAILS